MKQIINLLDSLTVTFLEGVFMKSKSWLKFFAIMGLAAVVVACGKDNKSTSDTVTGTSPVFIGQNQQVSADYNSFLSRVDNGQFAAVSQSRTFYYSRLSGTSSNNNCKTFLGFINYCSYSSSSSYSTAGTFTRYFSAFNGGTTHELGTNITDVHNNMKNLVRNIKDFRIGNGYTQIYYILTNDDIVYAFDFNLPLAANPVYQSKADGTGYTYTGATGY